MPGLLECPTKDDTGKFVEDPAYIPDDTDEHNHDDPAGVL